MAAAAENKVAVLPLEVQKGALSTADAAALKEAIRAAAGDALAPHGFTAVAADGTSQTALESGAAAAVVGRAARMEGAAVIAVSVYKPGSTAPAAMARVMGIGLDQLRSDVQAKIPGLVTGALGLTAPVEEPKRRPGTLRIPGGTPEPPQSATAAPQPATAAPPPANEAPLVTLIREVTAEVEKIRGLRRKQNLKILILDEKLFSRALREKAQEELTPAIVAAERARWTAFGLAPAGADPAKILLGVLDEQVAGFYDPLSKQLIVRKDPPDSAGAAGPDGLRLILAHEIEHALQDQNFGIPDLRTLPDDDVRLARTALYEGDAMAVMAAYGARRAHKPVKGAILGGAAMMRALDTETLLRLTGKSPELVQAPAILREELILPYAAGFALVAEVYRRGGFALVDRMFQNPPASSHQVLHPEAYFKGEQPAPLAPPAAPAGTRVVAQGRMGELGARVAMEVCVEHAVVKDIAPAWQGDAYTVVEGPEHALSLLWTSAWSGDGARQVSNLLRLEQPCWDESASKTMAGAARIGNAGSLVALARGSVELTSAVARQLTATALPPAAAPPIGEVPAPPAVQEARIENGSFQSPRLALRGTVPEGYARDPSNGVAEIAIQRPSAGGAVLTLVQEPLSGEALETFFQSASGQIATARGAHLSLLGTVRRKLAGATAEERAWAVEGAPTKLRIDVLPFCGGKAALTLVRVENGDSARDALERFAASLQPDGAAPACAELE